MQEKAPVDYILCIAKPDCFQAKVCVAIVLGSKGMVSCRKESFP